MKCIKSIFALVLTIALAFSMVSVPAFAEDSLYEIKGDSNIFLPKEGSVKLTYQLQAKADGTKVTDATYDITGDAKLKTYAKIVSSGGVGTLYVSTDAAGAKITVKAKSAADASINAELVVNVCATKYNTDFDNETGATVSNEIFSTKTAAVVDHGTGKAASGSTTSAATPSKYNLIITPENFSVSRYTVEGKFLAMAGVPNFLSIAYGEDFNAYFLLESFAAGSKPWAVSIKSSDYEYNRRQTNSDYLPVYSDTEYISFQLVVTDNKAVSLSLNGTGCLWPNLRYDGAVAGTAVTSFGFGTLIDDIEIYSGTKAEATYETGLAIEGDALVARAPIGVTANLEYSLVSAVEGIEVPSGAVWSLASAYTGVDVAGEGNTATVSVAGSAAAGTFTVQAVKDGEVLAKKTVEISGKVSNWMDKYDRYYNNLETQTVGSVLQYRMIGTSTWTDYALDAQNKTAYNHSSQDDADKAGEEWISYNTIIKKDETGNIYASATGKLNWAKNGATARMSANRSDFPAVLDNAKKATLELKFRIDSENIPRQGWDLWNIFAFVTNTSNGATSFDLDYGFVTDGVGKIVVKMENGVGGKDPRTLAYVPFDTWVNLRLEFDNTEDTFDMYVDDVLVLQNEKTGLSSLHNTLYMGCAFDDLAFYTGTKAVEAKTMDKIVAIKDSVAQTGNALRFTWSEASGEGETSSASALLMSSTDYSGKALFTAIYDNVGKLLTVKKQDVVKTDAGLSLAAASAKSAVPANGFAKVFLLDITTLMPAK